MKFLDLFSGLGGFRLGLEMAGHECVGHCEIDKFANKSYIAMHEPKESEWYGEDITKVRADELPGADIWCFGFPCQDISIAGKQKGFGGHRSSLFFTVTGLIRDIEEENRPSVLFIENVKNLLSVNRGYDFLKLLIELDEIGYDAEWQVLNSKHFGVPQNRERVFIVGHKRGIAKNNVFPIERIEINGNEIEKVYLLPEGIACDSGILQAAQSKGEGISRREMQKLLKTIHEGIQSKEFREIQSIGQEIQPDCEGSLQEIEAEQRKRTSCSDNTNGICGMVSIPTEEMLLLWLRGKQTSNSERCLQQQDLQIIDRQNRFIERLRKREFSSLLFAMQSYQGRLFYSVGDGRDWTKIYSKEVGRWNKTLNSILEEEVEEKYFLSEEMTKKLKLKS